MKLISNIEKIKILTESLANRDAARVKILELFDIFCKDFPIKIKAWIMDENRNIVSKNATPLNGKSLPISEIFSDCAKDKNISMHEKALAGKAVTYVIKDGETTYLTKLMPAGKKSKMVFGVSVDISSFSHALDVIDAHCDVSENEESDILQKLKNEELYKIVKTGGC